MKDVPIEKVDDREQAVPTVWRSALKQLADQAVLGTEIDALINIVIRPIDIATRSSHRYNIDDYPDKLGPIGEHSWAKSIYIWNSTSWKVLVDLTDLNGDITDLVLHAEVYETDSGYLIEPGLIYVP